MTKFDLSEIKFDEKGLVPVVVQDALTAEVLMTAWANEEALRLTAECGELVFWSRSRGCLWRKGETSGNVMRLLEMKIDCDGDTLLAIAEPAGPACHTGARSCFYRTLGGEDSTRPLSPEGSSVTLPKERTPTPRKAIPPGSLPPGFRALRRR